MQRSRSTRTMTRRLGKIPTSPGSGQRSEEHTSELQSQSNLVCRLLLEKKNPNHADRVYSVDTYLRVTDYIVKTFRRVDQKNIHVDYHFFWFDLNDSDHLLAGYDHCLYE